MNPVRFELVTPEKLLHETESELVQIPALEGYMGILPGHSPMITTLRPGVVYVETARGEKRFYVSGGVAEIMPDRCVVLAEDALDVDASEPAALETRIAELAARAAEDMGSDLMLDHQMNILNEILTGKR